MNGEVFTLFNFSFFFNYTIPTTLFKATRYTHTPTQHRTMPIEGSLQPTSLSMSTTRGDVALKDRSAALSLAAGVSVPSRTIRGDGAPQRATHLLGFLQKLDPGLHEGAVRLFKGSARSHLLEGEEERQAESSPAKKRRRVDIAPLPSLLPQRREQLAAFTQQRIAQRKTTPNPVIERYSALRKTLQ